MTNSRLTDPEVLELRFPVMVDEFSIRRGSGDGVVRKIRFRQAMSAGIFSGHRIVPPYGAAGDEPAKVGRNDVLRATGQREDLASSAEVALEKDDIFVIETPGGGGFGAM